MKAPNKLYISRLIYETWQYQTPDPDDNTEVEYIRKDALLEWLNGLIKDCENSNSYVLGLTSLAYQDLVNKIESL